MNGQRALPRGADALHDDTENAAPALLGLTNQAVIQVHFPETPGKTSVETHISLLAFLAQREDRYHRQDLFLYRWNKSFVQKMLINEL